MDKSYNTKKGYLKVSDLHSIYYEDCGNTVETPYLFIHGGPGAGFSERDKRFFNFEKQRVIFYNQRGASKSKPFGSIIENNTQELVNDILKLLTHLNISTVKIFGGSWGTTLALVFTIQYPEKVKSLLLRGIFLGNKASIEYYLNGGVEEKHPKEWHRFKSNVPMNSEISIPEYYLHQMLSGTEQNKKHFAYEWAFYEISIFKKELTENQVHEILKEIPYYSLAVMEAHFLTNNCFIEENYILKNVDKLKAIPVTIIHGKEDIICPIKFAEDLHSKLNNATLYTENGGHSDSEPDIENRIMTILRQNN